MAAASIFVSPASTGDSACTILVGYIPRNNICVMPQRVSWIPFGLPLAKDNIDPARLRQMRSVGNPAFHLFFGIDCRGNGLDQTLAKTKIEQLDIRIHAEL
jgi:hypothetical protein